MMEAGALFGLPGLQTSVDPEPVFGTNHVTRSCPTFCTFILWSDCPGWHSKIPACGRLTPPAESVIISNDFLLSSLIASSSKSVETIISGGRGGNLSGRPGPESLTANRLHSMFIADLLTRIFHVKLTYFRVCRFRSLETQSKPGLKAIADFLQRLNFKQSITSSTPPLSITLFRCRSMDRNNPVRREYF